MMVYYKMDPDFHQDDRVSGCHSGLDPEPRTGFWPEFTLYWIQGQNDRKFE